MICMLHIGHVHHADRIELARMHAELACVRSWRARALATVPTWRPCPIVAQRPSHTCTRRAWSRACDARGLVSGCWPCVQLRPQKSSVECGFGLTGVRGVRYGVANAPKPHWPVQGDGMVQESRRYRPKVLRDARYVARLPTLDGPPGSGDRMRVPIVCTFLRSLSPWTRGRKESV